MFNFLKKMFGSIKGLGSINGFKITDSESQRPENLYRVVSLHLNNKVSGRRY